MTNPRQLAARMMMVDIPSPVLDPETRAHLERYRFGGVCLFRRNIQRPAQVRQLTGELRSVLGPEVLIAIDQEGGAVQRVLELALAPSAMALGAVGDPKLAEQVGAAVGRGLISLGINWNFAPSLDVNTNPSNPVIGDRSFGSDPKEVTRLGLAWARGLEGAGVMASVKHFPGHGDTALDSHFELPTVNKPLDELERTELYPFRQAAAVPVASMMSAHIVFPALDPEHPATLSRAILTGWLRQKMGYGGVVITDALDMQAITKRYPMGQAAAQSLKAGADMILSLGKPEVHRVQLEAIAEALEQGAIPAGQAAASLQRLSQAAQRFPSQPRPYPKAQLAADRRLMDQVALRSITAYRQPPRPQADQKVLIVSAGSAFSAGPYGETLAVSEFAKRLKKRFPKVHLFVYDPKNATEYLEPLEEAAQKADFLLVASVGREPLNPAEARLLRQAFRLGKPAVHLALWNPYHLLALKQPAFISYGFRAPTLEALVQVLAGTEARGKLPFKTRGSASPAQPERAES